LDRFLTADPGAEAILLFEDTDIGRRRAVVDERVGLISTGDFFELEAANLIQSADYILAQAAERGPQCGTAAANHERARDPQPVSQPALAQRGGLGRYVVCFDGEWFSAARPVCDRGCRA
jgi:hypothetical protein